MSRPERRFSPRSRAASRRPRSIAGADGLEAYRLLAPRLGRLLAPGGIACLEIGAGQEEAVRELVAAEGFTVESRTDLNGIVRCLVLKG